MLLHCIFVQYPQRYAGEYAPSIHTAVDEYTNDDNPDYLQGKVKDIKRLVASGELEDFVVVDVEVDTDAIDSLFKRNRIKGTLARLDGTDATAVSVATGLSADDLDDLGGMPR